jgi:hypothetical protein
MKDIKRIPERTEQNVYNLLKTKYFAHYDLLALNRIVFLAASYPPCVRRVLCDILDDLNISDLHDVT